MLGLGYLIELIPYVKRVINNYKVIEYCPGKGQEKWSKLLWMPIKPKDIVIFAVPLVLSLFLLIGNYNPPLFAWLLLVAAILMFASVAVYFLLEIVIDMSNDNSKELFV